MTQQPDFTAQYHRTLENIASRDVQSVHYSLWRVVLDNEDLEFDEYEDRSKQLSEALWAFYRKLEAEEKAVLIVTPGIEIHAAVVDQTIIRISWVLVQPATAKTSQWWEKYGYDEELSLELIARPKNFGHIPMTRSQKAHAGMSIGGIIFAVGLIMLLVFSLPSLLWSGWPDWLLMTGFVLTIIGGAMIVHHSDNIQM